MKVSFVLLALVAVHMSAAGDVNILNNPDFKGDGRGGVMGWRMRNPLKDRVRHLGPTGPDGAQAIALEISDGHFLDQSRMLLVSGEPYRLAVYVRTKGLDAKNMRFLAWNGPWDASFEAGFLPPDTNGKWVCVEKTGKMVPSPDGRFTVGFYMARPCPGATVEVSAPSLTPLSESALAKSCRAPMPPKGKVRIVPVAPLLSQVDAATGDMTFYWPGDRPPGTVSRIEASVDGRKVANLPLGEGPQSTLSLGRMEPGRHAMAVRISADGATLAEDSYTITAVSRECVKDAPPAKRLNNFVVELLSAKLVDGIHAFACPEDGWVWIALENGGRDIKAFLDGGEKSVVEDRPHGRMETMLNLKSGRHSLRIEGSAGSRGKLRVNSVPVLVRDGMNIWRETTDISNYSYGMDFYRRHFFDTLNRYEHYGWRKKGKKFEDANRFFESNGIEVAGTIGIPSASPAWEDKSALLNAITNTATFADGVDVTIDEAQMALPRATHDAIAEACWHIAERYQNSVCIFWCDPMTRKFYDPISQTSELAAIFNTGGGRGSISLETYAGVLADPMAAYAQIDHFREIVEGVERMIPGGARHVSFYFAGYISPEGWNMYPAPEADFKVFFDEFFRRCAVERGFAGLGSVGFGAPFHADEEIVRWFARLMRHYCLEGSVESLAARYGYRYNPGLLANPDFADGFKGWTAHPASEGSLVPATVKNYGINHTHRKEVPSGVGDSVAKFTRSAERPNRLSQRLRLEKGKLYSLTCCYTDAADVEEPGSVDDKRALSIDIAGVEKIDGLTYVRKWPERRDPAGRQIRGGNALGARRSLKCIPRVVFRALTEDAELTFSDWAAPDAPGAPAGRVTLLNYIILRPYFADEGMGLRPSGLRTEQ